MTLLRAQRQLRQRVLRLDRAADGCADRRLRRRLQRQRHPHPLLHRQRHEHSPVVPSLSPSMDIQVSSNFERLLFEMNGRDGGMTADQLQRFRASGALSDRGRPARRVRRRGVRRGAGRRRRDARCDPPTPRVDRHVDRPAHRGRRRCRRASAARPSTDRSSRWRLRTRPSSPTRSSAPPGSGRPFRRISPICSTGPSTSPGSPTISRQSSSSSRRAPVR